jgi:hypothetical protein
MKRVVIATDGFDHALKAAELGAELAIKMDGAELHILAVAYYEPSEEVELRKFAQIEHLEGALMNVAHALAQGHTERARLKAEAKGAKTIKTALWPQEIRPRRSSPTSRPMPLTQSWLAGGEGVASLGCFSAASPRSSHCLHPVSW